MKSYPPDDVILTISHPFGDVEVELDEWIRIGPGSRDLVTPISARSKSTGRELPLSVIPLRYRNSSLSRLLISLRLLENPWKKQT